MDSRSYQPVIIVGAARSGTNMLRNVLTQLPGFHTWPCDEIPFIWRHGNRDHPHDEFTPEMATKRVRSFIRQSFDRMAGGRTTHLVEKTCANSLRVAFVNEVFPEAKFIYLVRDGRDAIPSAMKRWGSRLNLRYTLAKARFVPWTDLPYSGIKYLANRFRRLRGQERRLPLWGPVFRGMRELPPETPLWELAARQWQRCIEVSDRDFREIPQERVLYVGYEEFVSRPANEFRRIHRFLCPGDSQSANTAALGNVSAESVGKGSRTLSPETYRRIMRIIEPTLSRHGYEVNGERASVS